MARWMGLADFLDRSVNEGFSGGELKRSELLQLMAQKPDMLLLACLKKKLQFWNLIVENQ